MYTSENFLIQSKIAYLSNQKAMNDVPVNTQITDVVVNAGKLMETWNRYHSNIGDVITDEDVIDSLTEVVISAMIAIDTIRSNEALYIFDNRLIGKVEELGGRNKWIKAMFGISVDSYTAA